MSSIFDIDRWREIFQTLGANKMRTFLTAFGVSWGIFMLIIMLGAGSGLRNGVTYMFDGFETNSLYVWSQGTTMPYKGLPARRWYQLNNDDTEAIRQNIPEVAVIAPRNELGGFRGSTNVFRKDKSGAFRIVGDYPELRKLQPMKILMGRYLNHNDIKEKRKIAVIGTRVLNDLFGPGENPIGESISVNGVYFTVVGIFKTEKSGDEAESDAQAIFVPFSTFQQAFNYGDVVGYFGFIPVEGVETSLIEEKIKNLIKERHRVNPMDQFAVGSNNNQEDFEEYMEVFRGIDFLVWFVGTLTLIAGVIGISNIMLVIIKERTKEIGVRRAVGATPINIVSQIMLEAIVLTLLAGYCGLVLGVWTVELVGPLIKDDSFRNPEVNFNMALMALGVLVFSGCLAGFIPAYRALEIKPVEALRTEN